jgi:hypothetical protein
MKRSAYARTVTFKMMQQRERKSFWRIIAPRASRMCKTVWEITRSVLEIVQPWDSRPKNTSQRWKIAFPVMDIAIMARRQGETRRTYGVKKSNALGLVRLACELTELVTQFGHGFKSSRRLCCERLFHFFVTCTYTSTEGVREPRSPGRTAFIGEPEKYKGLVVNLHHVFINFYDLDAFCGGLGCFSAVCGGGGWVCTFIISLPFAELLLIRFRCQVDLRRA